MNPTSQHTHLTPAQKAVLAHYREVRKATGASPSAPEAMAHFGFTQQALYHHLRALVAQGYMTHDPRPPRPYTPTRKQVEP